LGASRHIPLNIMVTIDPLIHIRPSAEFRAFMGELRERQKSPEEEKNGDLEIPRNVANDEELLTAQDVRWIYERRGLLKKRDKGEGPQHFHELIKDCQMVLPEPKFPPRNPELEARIQRLKAEQAEREYKRMTSNVDGRQGLSKEMEQPFGKQMTELNNYLLLILQFVITVACSFAFGYFAPYFLRGVTHVATRLLSGIICAFVVAIADMYFVLKFLLEIEGVIQPDKTKVYEPRAPPPSTATANRSKLKLS